MPPVRGNTVYVESWELEKGLMVVEYEIEKVDGDRLVLRERQVHCLRDGQVTTLGGDITRTIALPAKHFGRSLAERLQHLWDDTQQMLSHFQDK